MNKNMRLLSAALVVLCVVPFSVPAQTTTEQTETGRFGALEPDSAESTAAAGAIYNSHWLFLGLRAGPSLRLYTPSEDAAFTGGDTYGPSLELGILADIRIVPLFSIQTELDVTWDRAAVWKYSANEAQNDLERYTRHFESFSLQFPFLAKLNFYPGKFRVSPFLGPYVILPLGKMKTSRPRYEEESSAASFSPALGVLGGLSLSYPLGPGMIFADLRYAADLGEPNLPEIGITETYRRHMVSLSMGFEFGLIRKQPGGSAK
ncbi:MAG: PorT family protein [Treponema sp.]|jgi:hypothetical protein|nr:PorT family protein [Treponema sp.]